MRKRTLRIAALIALPPILCLAAAGQEPKPSAPAAVNLAELSDLAEVTLDGFVFVKVPAGQFTLGTTDAQRKRLEAAGAWSAMNEDEQPSRRVTISRPFLIGKFEVTQKQWTAVISKDPPGTTNRERNAIKDPSAFKGEDLPVESVSWRDVQAFLERLNRAGGGKYRLPTEAEWEYAARAGGDDAYGLGAGGAAITAETLAEYAWLRTNAESKTHPVGSRKANAWGLHDMLGGVWEWCEDFYAQRFYATAPPVDPANRSDSTERVYRGGSWFLEPHQLRAAFRGGNLPSSKTQYAGFRLVRDL